MTGAVVVPVDRALRFDTFVVGTSNRLAVSAAHAVSEVPGQAYNPLFIYGESGRGKTHLVAAIAHRARERQPGLRVLFTTGDAIAEQLHAAVAQGQAHQLLVEYQQADLLLLDDVQFLTGQRETQNELLRLFNLLQQGGQQLVLTSDRSPSEIRDVDRRLVSRLAGGLVVDVGAPDYEMRLAILRNVAAARALACAPGVLEAVAELPFGNVRELKGALNKVAAYQQLEHRPAQVTDVRQLLAVPAVTAPAVTAPVVTAPVVTAPVVTAPVVPAPADVRGFLSDVLEAVHTRVEPWRVQLGEAIGRWRPQGYSVAVLERALTQSPPPDADALLAAYAAAVEQLQQLELQANAIDPTLRAHPAFRDVEAVGQAQQLVNEALAAAEPLPVPDPSCTLATFAVLPSTQLAVTAVQGLLDEPGRRFNPLLLHGPTGSGKTHLAHAIGNALQQRWPGWQVACLTVEAYVNDLVAAMQEGRMERWRQRLRTADLLILDDVQQLVGKERTQDELFHLVNHLLARGGQVVLTADRLPGSIAGLADRLRSRFEGGLVVPLEPPPAAPMATSMPASMPAPASAPPMPPLEHAPVIASDPSGPVLDRTFLDPEKVIWGWQEVGARLIEDYR